MREKTITNLFGVGILLFQLVMCLLPTSCIKDADDEVPTQPKENDTIPAIDSAAVLIDSAFVVTNEFIAREWMAQYTGFDLRQMKTSAIRRFVFFSPDGFYDSHVQGIVDIEDTITVYKEFEHEHGSYTLDVAKQQMKYKIEYDSLLNFVSDRLEYSPGKMVAGLGMVNEYEEKLWFSFEKEGKRDWIRTDDNLKSSDDHSARLVYIMRNE